mmetsp:Transcript_1272/g.2664  ORF Transcript_1272/g.2664 Transcript_1272/m.2664 type:complete len:305 (-) Transcript_1272:290-1204(-)
MLRGSGWLDVHGQEGASSRGDGDRRGRDERVGGRFVRQKHHNCFLFRHQQHAGWCHAAQQAEFPAVPYQLPPPVGPEAAPRHHGLTPVHGRQHGRHCHRLRPGSRRGAHGEVCRLEVRQRGSARCLALGRQDVDPIGCKVRGLPQGRALKLHSYAGAGDLPAVHVPLAPLQLPTDLRHEPGRDGVLQDYSLAGEHNEFVGHDPTGLAPVLIRRRPPAACPLGLLLPQTGCYPLDGRLLPCRHLARGEDPGLVRQGLPRDGRVCKLQDIDPGPGTRCQADPCRPLPRPKVCADECWRLPGQICDV